MTPHPDTERLRYEIEAKSQAGVKSFRHWPNGIVCSDIWNDKVWIMNSKGKNIASFNLKSWK